MKITEKYRPKSISAFVGDIDKVKEAEKYAKSKFPVILCGDPGIGKTSAAYIIAKKLDYIVVESNMSDARIASDLDRLGASLRTNKLVPTLFLLDEVDGVKNQKKLCDIIKSSKHPIILTANDKYKLGSELKRYCKLIELKPPQLGEVARLIRYIADSENIKDVSFDNISRDIRASINASFYNGDLEETEPNDFECTVDAFKENKVSSIDPIWLVDNVHMFYHGMDVYNNLKKLRYMIETNDPVFIRTLSKSNRGKPRYPNFARKGGVK